MQENIPDIEDRQFLTSQGHWEGDIVWLEEPCPGSKPSITAMVDSVNTEAEARLSYPHIVPQPGYEHTLNVAISAMGGASENATGYAEITDGNYSFTVDVLGWYGCFFHLWNQLKVTIPEDWNVNNTQLIIHFDFLQDEGLSLNIVYVNFQSPGPPVTGVQYLPIMGVG